MTNTIIKSIQKIIVKRRLIWTITSFWFLFSNLTKTCSGPIEANQRYLKKILNNSAESETIYKFSADKNAKSGNVKAGISSNNDTIVHTEFNISDNTSSNIQKAQHKTSSGTSSGAQTAPAKNSSTSSDDEGYETDTSNGNKSGNTEQESDGTFSNTSNDDKKNELGPSENPVGDGNNQEKPKKRSQEQQLTMREKMKNRRSTLTGKAKEGEESDSEDELNEILQANIKRKNGQRAREEQAQRSTFQGNQVLSAFCDKVNSIIDQGDLNNKENTDVDNQGATDEDWKNS
ncbi:hypothetical protein [Cardinium endosymbiont of Culicoides punctatus]|uniref:hypothetical protein n=1 Tax=Cardinium endosymbiont of Culicoides punctatus TaxID=2304601 RepID=UPI00105912A7|nr:hypothetical protein [Cardinium endosymbiont of Culicoides punctatus]TDG95344.1 hypothetical protein CCPUN_04830 [Cardinium endosymbiont of Culicoides punctatus]